MDTRVCESLGCSVWISKMKMVLIDDMFQKRKVFGMVSKSVILYGKIGGKTTAFKK